MEQKVKSTIKLAVLVMTLLYNVSSFSAEYINKITIRGNDRIENSTIEKYLKLHVGDNYDLKKEDTAIKNLYATSLFENISIKFLSGGELLVNVVETPFVTKVLYKGNNKIKTNLLSKELLTVAGESMSPAKIQLDVEKIKEIYKRSGRFSTIVTPKIEKLANNRVKVIFDITEGPKTAIRQIYFNGNNNYRNSELRSVILTKEARWFSFFETNDTYDPDRLEYDKELLKEFYQSVGFADFRVISATVELNPTKEYFTLTFSIEEGEKYNFGRITINNKLPNVDIKTIQSFVNVKEGETFNIKVLNRIADQITAHFAAQGYPGINVYPDITSRNPDHTVDITLVVDKADRVFINQINIVNNLKTQDDVIRRAFKIAEGDIFNRNYIERADRSLRNLDYFEKLLINVTPTERKDKYDINVEVDEKSTSSIGFDLGYNTSGGLFGRLSFLERNLIGTGNLLDAGVTMGKKSVSYNLGITDPYFLNKDLSLSSNVFVTHVGTGTSFLSQGDQNYKSRTVGWKNALGYDIAEDLNHEIDYIIKREVLTSPTTPNSIFLNEEMGTFITSAVGQTLTYDRTDSRIIPKNGYILSGTEEYAGLGGNNKYLKHYLDAKYFKSFINNKLTLKLSGSAGNVMGVQGKTVRISDRFNLGDYSLRGFAAGGIGPREKNTNEGLGGENYYTLSTELNFPTGLPQEFNLTGAVFVDVGSLWGVKLKPNSSYGPNDFYNDKSPRASIGFGFIWVTRLAPIRVDWAFPIRKKHYDDTQRFHLKFATHF